MNLKGLLAALILLCSFAAAQEEPVPPAGQVGVGIVACNFERGGERVVNLCFAEYPVYLLGPVESSVGLEWYNNTFTPYTTIGVYTESFYVSTRLGYGFGGNDPSFRFSLSFGAFFNDVPGLMRLVLP